MRVISRVGRLATSAQEKTQVDTWAGLFAAPVQPGFDPDTLRLVRRTHAPGGSGERALDMARALVPDLPRGTWRSLPEVALGQRSR